MRSSSHTHRRARELRRQLSPPEVLLWTRLRMLRGEGPTFRRQHPIGPYIADFYCAAARLVIEVDGAEHTEIARMARDERRDEYLRSLGYQVLRIPAGDVFRDADEVVQGIVQAALSPPPPPDRRSPSAAARVRSRVTPLRSFPVQRGRGTAARSAVVEGAQGRG